MSGATAIMSSYGTVPGSSFTHYRSITIDHTQVGGTDSTSWDFLFTTTNNSFKVTGSGGSVTSSSGYDIVFSTNNTGTGLLKWEVEKYVSTTGEIEAWIKIPNLSHSVDTVIYVCYGNAGITTFQGGLTGAVFSNHFKQVLHLADGTTLNTNDSLGTYNGTNNGGTAAAGQIDGGVNFGTLGNSVDSASGLYTMVGGSTTHTVTFIVRVDNPSFGSGTNYFYDGDSGTVIGAFCNIAGPTRIEWGYGGPGLFRSYTPGITLATGTFYKIDLIKTASGDNGKLILNGVEQLSWTGSIGDLVAHTASSHYGNYHGSSSLALQGKMDEIRIADTNRSVDWCLAEYNNWFSPGTFFTLGTEI